MFVLEHCNLFLLFLAQVWQLNLVAAADENHDLCHKTGEIARRRRRCRPSSGVWSGVSRSPINRNRAEMGGKAKNSIPAAANASAIFVTRDAS